MYNFNDGKKKQRMFAVIGLVLAGCMVVTTLLSYLLV